MDASKRFTSSTFELVEIAAHATEDRHHLLLDRKRLVLRLLQELGQPGAAGEQPLGRGVEIGGELGERLHLAVLRQLQP